MAENEKYIILRNSVEQASWISQSVPIVGAVDSRTFYGHKFSVVFGGWKPTLSKRTSVEETMGGRLDVSVGHIWKIAEYSIKVKYSLYNYEDSLYGIKSDLDNLFILNNPLGTPSNLITLVDHFDSKGLPKIGTPGFLMGDHVSSPLSVILSGPEAYYIINIQFRMLNAEGVS